MNDPYDAMKAEIFQQYIPHFEQVCERCGGPVVNGYGSLPGLDCANCDARYQHSGEYIKGSADEET